MNIPKLLVELHSELANLEAAIASLERLQERLRTGRRKSASASVAGMGGISLDESSQPEPMKITAVKRRRSPDTAA